MLSCNTNIWRGGVVMRKRLLVIFGIFGLLLAGCHTVPNAAQETNTITPTGYASEEVPRISLFYDGSLYLYNKE